MSESKPMPSDERNGLCRIIARQDATIAALREENGRLTREMTDARVMIAENERLQARVAELESGLESVRREAAARLRSGDALDHVLAKIDALRGEEA